MKLTLSRRPLPVILYLLAFVGVSSVFGQQKPAGPVRANTDPATRRGFTFFYNMEYDKAIRDFDAIVKDHPDDAFAVNHLLTAVMFKELYRIGALDSKLYSGDSFLSKKEFAPLDPKVKTRVHELIDQATALSNARLKANENDVDALYASGVTRGLRATWMGMGEKAWFAALKSAVGARRAHERVLELNPQYVDAKTIVGTHLYILGSLNWAVKAAASVAGLSGSRDKGLEYLRDAAVRAPESGMDARILLAVFLRREEKYDEALRVVSGMMQEYPHNFLVADERANLLNAAGHGKEAIVAYQQILENCRKNYYPASRPEQIAFGLGEAARGQRQFDLALASYQMVGSFKGGDPDLQQRADLGAGEMFDLLNRRDDALKMYNQVLSEGSSTPPADIAKKRIRSPYRVR